MITPANVGRMFELDFNEDVKDKVMSHEDHKFMKIVQNGVHQLPDGHLEMPLPFKEDDINLPNNKAVVMKRLNALARKMANNNKFKEDYEDFMHKLIDKDFAEPVPTDELTLKDGHTWYIPHHGIYHSKKPGKIRGVFDCSSTYNGESLNGHLLQGPDLTNNLDKVAFICDIEAMFYQLKVNVEHRNFPKILLVERE